MRTDTGDLIGPMGYWEDAFDVPEETVEKDRVALQDLADKNPQLFSARTAKKPQDTVLFGKLQERLKADGYGEGSMDLRYMMIPIWGSINEWPAQIIGSCVASGSFRVQVIRAITEVVLLGDLEEFFGNEFGTGRNNIAPFAPYSYRAGRKFAGINGNSDGSMCAPHIKGLMEYGILTCAASGLDKDTDGFPEPSGGIYRKWGYNDSLLNKYAEQGKTIKLVESESIKDANRLKDTIVLEFKPSMICSSWGFAPSHQHKDGFWVYKQSGTWPHNMSIVAVRVASDGNIFIGILNSWGPNAHKDGSIFWIPIELMDRWAKQANIQTIGELDLKDSILAPVFV